jgi:DNA-binding MarR family transcriptional regulator
LIEKGLAVRSRIEDDRRVVFVELSDEGRRLHEAYEGQRRAMGREMLAPLSHGEREIFIELMKKIAAPRPDAQ